MYNIIIIIAMCVHNSLNSYADAYTTMGAHDYTAENVYSHWTFQGGVVNTATQIRMPLIWKQVTENVKGDICRCDYGPELCPREVSNDFFVEKHNFLKLLAFLV